MLSTEEALRTMLERVERMQPAEVSLDEAAGLVLADDIEARGSVPPFTNSAMDGFACQASDIVSVGPEHPVRLRILEDVPAGMVATGAVTPGTAMRIMTGAPLPAGADTVVQVELTRVEGSEVLVLKALKPGANVRLAGEDMEDGATVLRRGTPSVLPRSACAQRRVTRWCPSTPAFVSPS